MNLKTKKNINTKPKSTCESCQHFNSTTLKKLGVDVTNFDFVVALAGNPNTGKSTVFNMLTGLRQHTGNWSGKTVIKAEGGYAYNEYKYKLIDLPGTYSLLSTSDDEEVARNFILFGKPTVTVIVVDAGRLERNLNLVLQILEITNHAVLCLNLIDEAGRLKIKVDERTLAKKLGIPVVPTSARFNKGIDKLIQTIHDVVSGEIVCKPHRIKNIPSHIISAVERLSKELKKKYPNIPNSRWIAFRLLEGDERIINALKNNELEERQLIMNS